MTQIHINHIEVVAEQHTLVQSTVLHLLPGVFISLFYIVFAPLTVKLGFPSGIALYAAIGAVLIPFELGYLLYQGKKRNGILSLKGIVLFRDPMPWWMYIVLGLPLFAWLGLVFVIVVPQLDTAIIDRLFRWVPDWFFLFGRTGQLAQYPKSTMAITAVVGLILNGIAGPIVEELY